MDSGSEALSAVFGLSTVETPWHGVGMAGGGGGAVNHRKRPLIILSRNGLKSVLSRDIEPQYGASHGVRKGNT